VVVGKRGGGGKEWWWWKSVVVVEKSGGGSEVNAFARFLTLCSSVVHYLFFLPLCASLCLFVPLFPPSGKPLLDSVQLKWKAAPALDLAAFMLSDHKDGFSLRNSAPTSASALGKQCEPV